MFGCLCSTVQVRSPMNQREDYHEAINIKERLIEESGKRLHPNEQVRQRPGQPFAWHNEGTERVDVNTGWRWYPPAASSRSSLTLVNTAPNPRIRRTPAHVIFSRVAQDLSHRVNRNCCVSQNSRFHFLHSMSHATSLLFLSHLSTLSTCTQVRLSIRPSTRTSLLSTSHGDLHRADQSNVSCRSLAETHSPSRWLKEA